MGYPMTYQRILNRWNLKEGYEDTPYKDGVADVNAIGWLRAQIAGDFRRLEQDQRDEAHLVAYANAAGITIEQAKIVLNKFFGSNLDW